MKAITLATVKPCTVLVMRGTDIGLAHAWGFRYHSPARRHSLIKITGSLIQWRVSAHILAGIKRE
ncbi:hypothetical protein D3C80_2129060 [compost metagenome]